MRTILCVCLCAAVCTLGAAAQSVVAAEYYLNVDPGPGNGTSIPVTASGTVSWVGNVPAATIAALPEGMHTLVCRVKDADGDWSVAFGRPFFKENSNPAVAPAAIVAAEYLIDSDPGPGNGVLIAVAAALSPQIVVTLPAASLAPLAEGMHTLVCRVRDADGDWSVAFARPFYKLDPLPESERFLTRLEYQWFMDGLPVGSAQSAFAADGVVSASWMPELPLPSAAEGTALQLVVTAFDTFGNQSQPASRQVTIAPPPTLAEWAQTVPANLRPPEARLPGDPFNTLQKYFFRTSPALPATGKEVQLVMRAEESFARTQSIDPQIGLKFRRSRYLRGVRGIVEFSSTLEENSWLPVSANEQITPLDAYTDEVTIFVAAPQGGQSKQFLRLKVISEPSP